MKKNNLPLGELAAVIAGELIVSLITVLVYILLGRFSYQVIFGLLLGACVTVLNFIILSVMANRALDRVMENRPEGELDEEQAAEFAKKNQGELQNAIKLSYIVRSFLMLGTLILAFLLKNTFEVIATVVPLLMFRPILTVASTLKRRKDK